MGKSKKKKARDFPKMKLKIGRKLRPTTATNTAVDVKKIVITEQLKTTSDDQSCVSYRGLSIGDLSAKLGHYNLNVRRDALQGLRQLLSTNQLLITRNLHTLIPSVGRIIACEKNDGTMYANLRAFFDLFCASVSPETVASHFNLLMTHILRALTHRNPDVRAFALKILPLIMRTYPELCINCGDLFDCFLSLLNRQRKWRIGKILFDALAAFVQCFAVEQVVAADACATTSFSVNLQTVSTTDITPRTALIDFPVLSWRSESVGSPLEKPEKLLEMLSPIFAIFAATFDKENAADDRRWSDIFALLLKRVNLARGSLSRTSNVGLELEKELASISYLRRNEAFSHRLRALIRDLCDGCPTQPRTVPNTN